MGAHKQQVTDRLIRWIATPGHHGENKEGHKRERFGGSFQTKWFRELSEKMVFDLKLDRQEASRTLIPILGRRKSMCKGPEVDVSVACSSNREADEVGTL